MPLPPKDPNSFGNVIRTALLTQSPGQGRPGLWVAVTGVIAAIASMGLVPQLGIVICLCIALVLILAGIGGGTMMQLDRARGVHPAESVDGVVHGLAAFAVALGGTPNNQRVDDGADGERRHVVAGEFGGQDRQVELGVVDRD